MGDLSTYRIADFILFSKDTLLEIYEAYNLDWWPWQVLWLALAVVILIFAVRPTPTRSRVVFAIVACAWAWVALVFHLKYFSQINIVANYFAYLFLTESLLLFLFGTIFGKLELVSQSTLTRNIGIVIFVLAAFVPIELFFGQSLSQILIFGFGAERTAIGTVGLLLCVRNGVLRYVLMIPALIWCAITVLMFYGMK